MTDTGSETPHIGANIYITHCIHGLDLRLNARCYLCRPATDPAGLDVDGFLGVLDEVIRILKHYEHGVMVDSTELRRSVAARLSVADGPGPEERP